jgi:AcrR family transcriptional regulator
LDAALDLLSIRGFRRLSLRMVARHAGVSQAAPYHHFRDKGALLAAVAEQGFLMLRASMRMGARKARNPRERLEALGRAYVKFALDHRSYFLIMFGSDVGLYWDESPLKEVSMGTFDLLVEAVKAVLPARSHIDPMDAALLGWSSMHGLASLWLDGPISRVAAGHRDLFQLSEAIAHLSARALMD